MFISSAFMFILQLKTAVEKLYNPLVVESTKYLGIADIEKPMITFCPRKQFNNSNKYFKYSSDLFHGRWSKNETSWGGHVNISYEQMLKAVYRKNVQNILIKDYLYRDYQLNTRMHPMNGFCYDLTRYSTATETTFSLELSEPPYKLPTMDIFITDGKLKKYGGVYHSSHLESKISIDYEQEKEFEVVVKIKSFYDPRNPDACHDYKEDEYYDCVDREAQNVFKPHLGCNPPWLSPRDECKGVLLGEEMRNITDDLIYGTGVFTKIQEQKEFNHERKCLKPCNITTSYIKFRETRKAMIDTVVVLNFRSEVEYRSKELAYEFYDFLIDVGSSLGLWLGLSVTGWVSIQ